MFWVGAIVWGAAFIHGLVGFAFALLAVPLLSFFWPLKDIVPLMALLGAVLNGLLFLSLRKYFFFSRIKGLLLGAIPGVVCGTVFLSQAPEVFLKGLLGLTLIIYGVYGLLKPQPRFVLSDKWGYFFGFWAGMLGAALNTPGPPVVVYVTLKNWSKNEVKSTLQGYFLLLILLVICAHTWEGLITIVTLKNFLKLVPLVVFGLFLGHKIYYFLNTKSYLRLLYLMLIIAGFLCLGR